MASPTTRSGGDPGAVLVTGGAGYIGSHAAKALAAAGRRVVIYDNLTEGHREAALGADLVVGDTRDVARLRSVMAEPRRDGRHALRGLGRGRRVGARPGRLLREQRRRDAVGPARRWPAEQVPSFIFSSTCAVFGEPIETPIVETPPDASDQRLRRNEAGRRARAAALRAGLRHPLDLPAVLQRRRCRSRTATWGRITGPSGT